MLYALLALLIAGPRQTIAFDRGWRFHLGDVAGAQERVKDFDNG